MTNTVRITPLDDSKVSEGTWTKYRGVDLKIARAGNPEFTRLFNQLTRPHRREIEKDTLDEGTMRSILCETLAKTVLLDWKNFNGSDGEIEYSIGNAKSLLLNDPDCREHIQEFARDVNNYVIEELEQIVEK